MATTEDRVRQLVAENLEVDGQPLGPSLDLDTGLARPACRLWISLPSRSWSPRSSTSRFHPKIARDLTTSGT